MLTRVQHRRPLTQRMDAIEDGRQALELVPDMATLIDGGVKVASPRGFEPLLPP